MGCVAKSCIIDLSKYAIQLSEKSTCKHCSTHVNVLCPRLEAVFEDKNLPFFFLCPKCGAVAQAGHGEIAPPEKGR